MSIERFLSFYFSPDKEGKPDVVTPAETTTNTINGDKSDVVV